MKLSKNWMQLALALVAAALFAGPASADTSWLSSGDSECIASCREVASTCVSNARDAFNACQEGFGCADMRTALRDICFGPERDAELCKQAGSELRACLEPCLTGLYEDAGVCRFEVESCIATQCSEDSPLRRLLDRFSQYRP